MKATKLRTWMIDGWRISAKTEDEALAKYCDYHSQLHGYRVN